MVSLANEVHSFHVEKKRDVSSFAKSPVIGGLSQEPSLYDILSYSYCYVGIMTGKSTELSSLNSLLCVCLYVYQHNPEFCVCADVAAIVHSLLHDL